jgi:phage gp36-like protein
VSYATEDDIVEIYGQRALDNVAPLVDESEVIDHERVGVALDRASAEVDAYLSGRYEVPLASAGMQIKQVVVDIAMYRMALSLSQQTSEHRLRYEDSIKFLQLAASGKSGVGLGVEETDSKDPGADSRKIRTSFFRRA